MEQRIKFKNLLLGIVLLLTAFAACDNSDSCKTAPECTHQGKCTADKSGACIVGSAEDCKSAEPCKLHGKCSAKEGACSAASDDECKSSDDCQKLASCSAYQGSCVNLATAVHSECTKTCASEGLCVSKGGKCVALSRLHCAGTIDAKPEAESPCATLGLCTAENGRCTAGTNE
ncbi:MAG TPA: hypothetical protein VGP93_18310, partial [Polyangiaceae bacterium]|nr:hypothetical protein [Polyangiaceae bacterium]